MPLHILQGGIENGDKRWLERAAKARLGRNTWIAPKGSKPGDDAVIFVGTFGFFATAKIASESHPRDDWPNRYGAAIRSIRLIVPPISLPAIQRAVPELTWANYPRSITTPSEEVAESIRRLIRGRRKTGLPELDDEALLTASRDELRAVATLNNGPARRVPTRAMRHVRSIAVRRYVLLRANGVCEHCREPAPFFLDDGTAYLEPHHILRLADEGPDHPKNVAAICPNCHREAHFGANAKTLNSRLHQVIRRLEMRIDARNNR